MNRVSYAGEVLITVFHRGIEDEDCSYERKMIREKINRYNLIFEQYKVNEEELNNLSSIIAVQEGFLTPKNTLNIYSGRACAKVTRFITGVKPRKVIKTLVDRFEFRLPIDTIITINDFIKKYTGVNLNKNPIFYGDTFIYEPIEIDISVNKSNGLTLRNIKGNTEIIIRFRRNGMIVSTYKNFFKNEVSEVEINPHTDWISLDIEVYENNKLIYFDYDVAFVRSIHLGTRISGKSKIIKLNRLSSFFEIPTNPTKMKSVIIGEEIDKVEDLFQKSNLEMSRRIKNAQDEGNIIFFKPGEIEYVLKVITKFLNQIFEEVWIFDPYLTDKNLFKKTLDWLRIFIELPLEKMNFVFYCKEDKAYNYNSIRTVILENPALAKTLENRVLNWTFIETKSAIHDRFILCRTSDNQYSGITIGTSLNSVDINHFCVNYLNHTSTKVILKELINYLEGGNVVGSCKL